MEKHLARQLIKQKLQQMENKAFLDQKIFESFIRLNLDKNTFFVYNSLECEVDTKKIIEYLLKNKKTVYLPCVVEDEMKLVKVSKNTKYIKGAFSILEPVGEKLDATSVHIDVCIAPLLGFDKNLNRLGKGKGYYDKFFSKVKCFKLALAYDKQEIESIDAEKHDIKLDMILTENRKYCENN